jgi:hypothetical protein
MMIGCTNETGRVAAFEAWLGRTIDIVRIYCDTDAVGTGRWVAGRNHALAGRIPAYSWNVSRTTANLTAIASGSQDATINAIADYAQQVAVDSGVAVRLSFNHEVENETGFTKASWIAAASRVYGIIHTRAPLVTTYYAYLGGFDRNQFEGRDPASWWPVPNSPMELGVDYYNWRGGPTVVWAANNSIRPADDLEQPPGASLGTDATAGAQSPLGSGINSWLELADFFGVPLCLPEFGEKTTEPGNPLGLTEAGAPGMRAYFTRFSNQWADDPRITWLTYFERNTADGANGNWRLSGGTNTPADPLLAPIFDSLSTGTPAIPTASAGVGAILG